MYGVFCIGPPNQEIRKGLRSGVSVSQPNWSYDVDLPDSVIGEWGCLIFGAREIWMAKILKSFESLENRGFVWFCGILTCEVWGGVSEVDGSVV